MYPSPINNTLSVRDPTLLPATLGSLTYLNLLPRFNSWDPLSHLSPLHPYFSHISPCFLLFVPHTVSCSQTHGAAAASEASCHRSRVRNLGLSTVGLHAGLTTTGVATKVVHETLAPY